MLIAEHSQADHSGKIYAFCTERTIKQDDECKQHGQTSVGNKTAQSVQSHAGVSGNAEIEANGGMGRKDETGAEKKKRGHDNDQQICQHG